MRNVDGCITILSHVDAFKTDDAELRKAIEFYMSKIFTDVTKKYRAVRDSGQSLELPVSVDDTACNDATENDVQIDIRTKEEWLQKIVAAAEERS